MPTGLLDEIKRGLPGWLSEGELAFEHDLAQLCDKHGIVGVAGRNFISFPLLAAQRIDPSYVAWVKSGFPDKNEEQIKSLLEQFTAIRDPLDDRARGYLGWLITNPEFVNEWETLRQARQERGLSATLQPGSDAETDPLFRQILEKWLLSGTASWELPIPQGPNLTNAPWPGSVTDRTGMTTVTVASTIALPTRLPIQEILRNLQRQNRSSHLREWWAVQDRKSGGRGIDHYQNVFRVHFYLHRVLNSRYGTRITGNVERIDSALSEFLSLSPPGIKAARQDINRRLGTSEGRSMRSGSKR